MNARRVVTLAVTLILVSTVILALPFDVQADIPVDVWPTDGWATSTPEAQGMDSTALSDVYTHVRNSDARIRSMLVIRHGYLVAEEYFLPQIYDINTTHILFSVTKSVVSSLIGIAIDQGFIDNTSQLLLDFFPDRTITNLSAWKDTITLEDVLRMRSGFDWDEDNYTSFNDFFGMTTSTDWAQYVLDRPMAYEPGSAFYYNSGNSHLLAHIINVTTGMTPLAFADQYLFGPLGITRRAWTGDPQGIHFGGSNLALTPRDMAKFGLLFINNGTWDGQQIVSSDWVNKSNQGPATTYYQVSYGYQWWIDDDDEWYSARGYNGQFIYVIPEHDIVVVFSSDNEDGPYEYDWLVSNGILGAVTNNYPDPIDPPLQPPYLLVGAVSIGVIAVVAVIVRVRR